MRVLQPKLLNLRVEGVLNFLQLVVRHNKYTITDHETAAARLVLVFDELERRLFCLVVDAEARLISQNVKNVPPIVVAKYSQAFDLLLLAQVHSHFRLLLLAPMCPSSKGADVRQPVGSGEPGRNVAAFDLGRIRARRNDRIIHEENAPASAHAANRLRRLGWRQLD